MEVEEWIQREARFKAAIAKLQQEYYLYFGLKSIREGLKDTEHIEDHIRLERERGLLHFRTGSDLPEEIREKIIQLHQAVFAGS